MPVLALPEDKPKIAFYGAMMAIQNFGFFVMYYQIYPFIPSNGIYYTDSGLTATADCEDVRFWVAFFALDCFVESFCCVWMAMGGYISDKCMFTFGWFLHLIVALPYCVATVGIPVAIYSDKGKHCREAMGYTGFPIEPVYWVHCGLFLVYVWMMLSITYYSFVKATFVNKATVADVSLDQRTYS